MAETEIKKHIITAPQITGIIQLLHNVKIDGITFGELQAFMNNLIKLPEIKKEIKEEDKKEPAKK